ncbi:MAG: GNAT family N-acetyltransferase [Candidatus Micrarchaeaceae archaeon]|jgi:N-acetylglutamate synthase-like GNAT family acetyltransferase
MIKIQTASLKDLQEVSRLIRLGVEEDMLLPRTSRELRSLIRKDNVIVASDENKLVGVVALDFYSTRLSELRSLYIMHEYRKAGIGGKLIARLLERAQSLGIDQILTVTDKRNKDWFVKHGFDIEPHGFKVALFRTL